MAHEVKTKPIQRHDVESTLIQLCVLMTLNQSWNDVVSTLCDYWEMILQVNKTYLHYLVFLNLFDLPAEFDSSLIRYDILLTGFCLIVTRVGNKTQALTCILRWLITLSGEGNSVKNGSYLEKGSTLKGKNLLPLGANSFLLKWTVLEKGIGMENEQTESHKNVTFAKKKKKKKADNPLVISSPLQLNTAHILCSYISHTLIARYHCWTTGCPCDSPSVQRMSVRPPLNLVIYYNLNYHVYPNELGQTVRNIVDADQTPQETICIF